MEEARGDFTTVCATADHANDSASATTIAGPDRTRARGQLGSVVTLSRSRRAPGHVPRSAVDNTPPAHGLDKVGCTSDTTDDRRSVLMI